LLLKVFRNGILWNFLSRIVASWELLGSIGFDGSKSLEHAVKDSLQVVEALLHLIRVAYYGTTEVSYLLLICGMCFYLWNLFL
jgi:hypothetical protein